VRRIVTDSIEDIGPALASLGRNAQLVCVYGGDGTIQRLLDRMLLSGRRRVPPQIAFIGGGTMNVTATWCGFTSSAGRNFREIVRAYQSGALLLKEVPLLHVSHGDTEHLGFIFGMGVPIRVLDAYEHGHKGKRAALKVVAGALAGLWTGYPRAFRSMLGEMPARIEVDGEVLGYERYATVFCNVTGRLNPGVAPFVRQRTRDTFHYAAYASGAREISLMLPLLIRGVRPIDTRSLLTPVSTWRKAVMSIRGEGQLPADPRYVNDIAKDVLIETDESLYTVDGELFQSLGEPLRVRVGPYLRLAVSSRVGLHPTVRLADEVTAGVVGSVVQARSR
jgi:diacylglycerol kinase family enzyme